MTVEDNEKGSGLSATQTNGELLGNYRSQNWVLHGFNKTTDNDAHTGNKETEERNSQETNFTVANNVTHENDTMHQNFRHTVENNETTLRKYLKIEGNDEKEKYDDEEDDDTTGDMMKDQTIPLTNHKREDGFSTRKMEEPDEETLCGIFECKPPFLQKLASKKVYILVYGLIGMFNLAAATYFTATISTLEKRFKMPSKTSGIIIAVLELGNVMFTLILSYIGSKGHKPRWIACGTLLVGLTYFMRLTPHLVYGPGQDALELTEEYGSTNTNSSYNETSTGTGTFDSGVLICRENYEEQEDCSAGGLSTLPTIIMLVSFYLTGVGSSVYYTLGMAYLDDNVRKNKAPFLMSVSMLMKMLGPTLGYLFASYALHIYVDTSAHPTITPKDPRWIGAWWLGWGPFGIINAVLAMFIALFPKKLPRAAKREREANETKQNGDVKTEHEWSLAGFKEGLMRLVKNKILVLNTLSSVLFLLGLVGKWIFLAKYMETQFRQTASQSSFITGTVGLVFSALGILAGGSIISKFQPRARYLAGWNVCVETLEIVGYILYGFLTCSVDDLHGSKLPDNTWNLTAECNSHCDCGTTLKYSPVCAEDGSQTFYSACHAGCTTMEFINGTKMFGNCSCVGEDALGWVVEGPCPVNCGTVFTMYLVIRCTMTFFSSSGRAGNTIIQLRCVNPDDKSMSIGFTDLLVCLLAFIPGPILFGILLDSACMVWGQTCGEQGNCWLYDGGKLAYLVNFTASGCLLAATLFDVGVWYFVKDLQIYDKKDEKKDDTKEEKTNSIEKDRKL